MPNLLNPQKKQVWGQGNVGTQFVGAQFIEPAESRRKQKEEVNKIFKNNLNYIIKKYKIKISSAIKKIFAISKNIISVNLIPQIQNGKCKIKTLSQQILQNFKNLQIPKIKFRENRFIEFEITKPKFSGIRLIKFKISKTKIFAVLLFILTLGFFINLLFHFKEKEVDAVGVSPIQLRKPLYVDTTAITPAPKSIWVIGSQYGIIGQSNNATGWAWGLYGWSKSNNGWGVVGYNDSTGGGGGVEGYSLTGIGVWGESAGSSYGVYGKSANSVGVVGQSANNWGVYGYNASGNTYGVVGKSLNYGVYGEGTNSGYGVHGSSGGVSNTVFGGSIGVFGGGANYGVAAQSPGTGVYGYSSGSNWWGVYGQSLHYGTYGYGDWYGVLGDNPSGTYYAVMGRNQGINPDIGLFGTGGMGVFGGGPVYGVVGQSSGFGTYGYSTAAAGSGYAGVKGYSPNTYGVVGQSTNNYGVYGESAVLSSNYAGVYGQGSTWASGVYGTSNFGYGVYGYSNGNVGVYGQSNGGLGVLGRTGVGIAVYGEALNAGAYAGYFWGPVFIRNYGFLGSDYAEYILVDDFSIEAGDLVSISDKAIKTAAKSKKPYDYKVIGIISTKPTICGGYLSRKKKIKISTKNLKNKNQIVDDLYTDKEMHKLNYRKLALVGQVPAKVCLEGGIIHKGDPLTTSSLPGYAMKAAKAGPIVGKALEDFDGSHGKTGKILVFCNLSFYYPEGEIEKLKTENKELKDKLSDINIRLEKLEKLINK